MRGDRVQLSAAGNDAMADAWEEWSSRVGDDPRRAWLEGAVSFNWIRARR